MSHLDAFELLDLIGQIDVDATNGSAQLSRRVAQLGAAIPGCSADGLTGIALYANSELQSCADRPQQVISLLHASRSLFEHLGSGSGEISSELSSEVSTLCVTAASFFSDISSTSTVKVAAASTIPSITRCLVAPITTPVFDDSGAASAARAVTDALAAALRDSDAAVVISALDAATAALLLLHSASSNSSSSSGSESVQEMKQKLVSDLCTCASDQTIEMYASPAAADVVRTALSSLSHVSTSIQRLSALIASRSCGEGGGAAHRNSDDAAAAASNPFSFESICNPTTGAATSISSSPPSFPRKLSLAQRAAILAAVESDDASSSTEPHSLHQRSVFADMAAAGAAAAGRGGGTIGQHGQQQKRLTAEEEMEQEAGLQDKIDAVIRSLREMPDASNFHIEQWHHDGLRFMQHVAALQQQQAELDRLQENERRGMAGIPVGQLLSSLPSSADTLDVALQLHDSEQLRNASLVMLVRESLAAYHTVAERDQPRAGAVLARLISKLPGHCVDRVLDDIFDSLRREVREAHTLQSINKPASSSSPSAQQRSLSDFSSYRLVIQVLYAQYSQLAVGGAASSGGGAGDEDAFFSSFGEDGGGGSSSASRRRRRNKYQNEDGHDQADDADDDVEELFEQQLDFMTEFQRQSVVKTAVMKKQHHLHDDATDEDVDIHVEDENEEDHHHHQPAAAATNHKNAAAAAAASTATRGDNNGGQNGDELVLLGGETSSSSAADQRLLRFFSRLGVDATRLGTVDYFNMNNPIAWISAAAASAPTPHQQAQISQVLTANGDGAAAFDGGDLDDAAAGAGKEKNKKNVNTNDALAQNSNRHVFVSSGAVVPVVTSKSAIAFEDEPARIAGRTPLGHTTLRLLHLALDLCAMEMRLASTELHHAVAQVFLDLPVVPTSAWLFLHIHLCSGKMAGELGGMGANVLCYLGLRVLSFLAVNRPTDASKAVSMLLHYTRSADRFPRKASINELMQLLKHNAVCSLTVRPAIGRFALHSAATVTASCLPAEQQQKNAPSAPAASSSSAAAAAQAQQAVSEEKRAVELSRHIALAAAVATLSSTSTTDNQNSSGLMNSNYGGNDLDVASELIKLLLEIFSTEPAWRHALLHSKELELLVQALCATQIDEMLTATHAGGGGGGKVDHHHGSAAAAAAAAGGAAGVIAGSEPLITFILTVATGRIFHLSRAEPWTAKMCARILKRHCDVLSECTGGDPRFYCPASAFYTTRELRDRILPAAISCFDAPETVPDGEAALRNCVQDASSFLTDDTDEEEDDDDAAAAKNVKNDSNAKETRGMAPDELLEYLVVLSNANHGFSSKAQQQAIATLVRLSTKTEHGATVPLVFAQSAQRVLIELKRRQPKPPLLMRTINMLLARERMDVQLRRFAAAVARDLVVEEVWTRDAELWRGVRAYLEQEAAHPAGGAHIQVVVSSLPKRILQDLCQGSNALQEYVRAQPELRDMMDGI